MTNEAKDEAARLIARSVSHSEIATGEYTDALHTALEAEAEDWGEDGDGGADYWHGDDWRVMLRARIVAESEIEGLATSCAISALAQGADVRPLSDQDDAASGDYDALDEILGREHNLSQARAFRAAYALAFADAHEAAIDAMITEAGDTVYVDGGGDWQCTMQEYVDYCREGGGEAPVCTLLQFSLLVRKEVEECTG